MNSNLNYSLDCKDNLTNVEKSISLKINPLFSRFFCIDFFKLNDFVGTWFFWKLIFLRKSSFLSYRDAVISYAIDNNLIPPRELEEIVMFQGVLEVAEDDHHLLHRLNQQPFRDY